VHGKSPEAITVAPTVSLNPLVVGADSVMTVVKAKTVKFGVKSIGKGVYGKNIVVPNVLLLIALWIMFGIKYKKTARSIDVKATKQNKSLNLQFNALCFLAIEASRSANKPPAAPSPDTSSKSLGP
jgi:hypothetical protein